MNWYEKGGSAFPIMHSNEPGSYDSETGMSLRDYFAGQALSQSVEDYGTPGIRGRDNHGNRITPYSSEGAGSRELIIARQAYKYADAMLKAREVSE